MAIKVQSTPPQAFSADFDLQGSAQTGNLTFTSPLGNTLARLEWTPNAAVLHSGAEQRRFDSLDALTHHTLGTELPIDSLFLWLQGISVDTPGWQADLHEVSTGRIQARSLDTGAPAELKIILE